MKKQQRADETAVKRAALYIRVSTEEQAMHGLSLQAQRETLIKYADTNGMKVSGVYTDEGITARKKYRNRTAFMQMLNNVRAGAIDVILFIKLDRWFRNIADYYEVQRILDEYHVEWIATEERYDTTTANGRLNLNIRLSIAQDESDRTSERIKFVFENKLLRKEVVSGKIPLGYCIADKRLAVNPNTVEVAQDIFKQYIDLRSIRALRKFVMDKYGIVYSHSGLSALLQNERYIGCAHDQADFCPAIIKISEFDLAQSIITERAQRNADKGRGWTYMFTGLVYCAECGNRLSAHTVAGKYIYYRCTRYEKLHLCTHKKRTSELVLEQWLLDNLILQFEAYNSDLQNHPPKVVPMVDEAKTRRKMEKLKDLYLSDLIDRDTYERDYTALRDALKIESATIIPSPEPVNIVELKTLLSAYSCLTKPSKKAFWSRTVSKIVITENDEFFVYPISP